MFNQKVLQYNKKLIDTLQKKKWVCFGAGLHCFEFLKKFCVDQKVLPLPAYACDNNKSRWGQTIFNVPICSPAELDKENYADCVIVVTATEPCSIMSELFSNRAKYYFEIATVNQLDLYLTFMNHQEEFLEVYNRLEDEKSKEIYEGMLSCCMAGNINFPMYYTPHPYWGNDIIEKLNDNDVIVMGGAYDGKHIDRAFSSNSDVIVHGFEPNQNVFDNLKYKYENNQKVFIHNYALYDRETTLSFDASSILGAKVVEHAETKNGGAAECSAFANSKSNKFGQGVELFQSGFNRNGY